MYLTAQRVKGQAGTGINAFLHDGSIGVDVDWAAFDKGEVSPGDMSRQSVEVPPGGNSVLSYLDIVAPGVASAASVRAFLREPPVRATQHLLGWQTSAMAARCESCGGAAYSPPIDAELAALAERALALLEPSRRQEPIEIRRRLSAAEFAFELSPRAIERLRQRHGAGWTPARLRVRQDVASRWRAQGMPSLEETIVGTLTGLSAAEVEAEGGIRMVTERTED